MSVRVLKHGGRFAHEYHPVIFFWKMIELNKVTNYSMISEWEAERFYRIRNSEPSFSSLTEAWTSLHTYFAMG